MGKKIFFLFSFLLLSLSSLYCLILICGFTLVPEVYAKTESKLLTANRSDLVNETKENPTSSASVSPTPETQVEKESEIPAAAEGTAKGKIIYRSIDSSAANLKYQKIYIKNQTGLNINLKTELLNPPELKIVSTDAPQVLIVHTHTTECYMNEEKDHYTASDLTRSTDNSKNMVAVGEVLKDALDKKGIMTVHAAEKHDFPEYTGSYGRAEQTIKKYLEKYPSIKVVVDLHRDSVTDPNGAKSALVTNINGKKAAQVMLVSGCESGSVTDFPNWKENFRLAIKLQQAMEVMYPSFARPILFTPRKYNQHLTKGSLLIECGTEANTLEQAKYSAELLGECLAATLNTLK